MKPNLIDYKIIDNDLKILKFNNNTFNLNTILIIVFIVVMFLVFYIFRDKDTKEIKQKRVLDKLQYIYNISDNEIQKKNNIENTKGDIQNISEYGVNNYSLNNLRNTNEYNIQQLALEYNPDTYMNNKYMNDQQLVNQLFPIVNNIEYN